MRKMSVLLGALNQVLHSWCHAFLLLLLVPLAEYFRVCSAVSIAGPSCKRLLRRPARPSLLIGIFVVELGLPSSSGGPFPANHFSTAIAKLGNGWRD